MVFADRAQQVVGAFQVETDCARQYVDNANDFSIRLLRQRYSNRFRNGPKHVFRK